MSTVDTTHPLAEQFWERVPVAGPDQCWEWMGAKTGRDGYGRVGGQRAHRVSWEIANGRPIPEGLIVLHSCDNPPCVNPRHLSVGTNTDNMRDASAKGRLKNGRGEATHCREGHEFSGENLYIDPTSGRRRCRTCRAAYNKQRKAKMLRGEWHTPAVLLGLRGERLRPEDGQAPQ